MASLARGALSQARVGVPPHTHTYKKEQVFSFWKNVPLFKLQSWGVLAPSPVADAGLVIQAGSISPPWDLPSPRAGQDMEGSRQRPPEAGTQEDRRPDGAGGSADWGGRWRTGTSCLPLRLRVLNGSESRPQPSVTAPGQKCKARSAVLGGVEVGALCENAQVSTGGERQHAEG